MSNRVNVQVKQGIVSGVREKLPDGGEFRAFRGIPYAQPPTGALRFRAPKPLDKFRHPVLDCSTERDVCFTRNTFTQELEGSEDCLHLNVYAPDSPRNQGAPLPVMVFVHGGAFMWGSGNSDCYSPEYLLLEDVIVVTFNYRLGPLGFLHFPSHGVEGNAGLKDQRMVLQWVQENIANFNGDPKNVTLFGESAGAASVHLHLLSPISRQFFHKAICQSGSAIMEWVMQADSIERTRNLARAIEPTVKTDQEVYDTLMNADTTQLMGSMLRTLTADEKRRGLPMPFKPVIDLNSDDPVVDVPPMAAIKSVNDIPNIPLMLGITDREGIVMMSDAVKKIELYDSDMARLIPRTVNVAPEGPSCDQLAKEIKNFYFGTNGYTKDTVNEMADLMTDYHFAILANTTAELHARYQKRSPLYYFSFAFDGELNMNKKMQRLNIPGACHADDLSYLFLMRVAGFDVSPDSPAGTVRSHMCRMWCNFAKYGNPTPDHDQRLPFRWDPVPIARGLEDPFVLKCLEINERPRMIVNPEEKRMNFWRGVYQKWNDGFLRPKL